MVNISGVDLKLKHLPDYILEEIDLEDEEDENENEIFYLLNEYEEEIVLALFNIISYSGGGRIKVYRKLKEEYDDLSEYKTRKFIELLSENNLIEIGRGRSGMKIIDTSRKFLENNL